MKPTLIIIILVAMVVGYEQLNAQAPTYEAILINDVQVSDNQYEFDIYIRRTGTTPFEAFGVQVCLLFNDAISNGGTLTSTYIVGTSEMNAAQIPSNPNVASVVDGLRVWKLAAKIVTEPGLGTIISNIGNGTRLGRFRINTSAASFSNTSANLVWNFNQGTYGYATKISAWVGGYPTEITVPANHYNMLSNTPLPVEIQSFSAVVQGRDVELKWQTAIEINSDSFEIERALASSATVQQLVWEKVGSLAASGNSSSTKEYSFTDKKLNSGKYSYRLKMVDNDGSYSYSKEVEAEVSLPKEYAISQNYPNPFNPSTKIDYQLPFDSKVTLELYGITGEKVATILNSEQSAGYYTMDVNASELNLSSGVYIYRIVASNYETGDRFLSVRKMIMLK